jgi:ABC-type transport system involved in cytochrome bd biosynthesis fused ATPase/permease subunit
MENLSFSAKKGQLVIIIGNIGSGKSSLFYSLLGEMKVTKISPDSSILINGSLAYIGQKPWLLDGSILDNILLDKPLNERLLNYVIRFSALIEDLKTFPKGIEHLIGENGTLLSGG